jgi:error-prone DNA polymerase
LTAAHPSNHCLSCLCAQRHKFSLAFLNSLMNHRRKSLYWRLFSLAIIATNREGYGNLCELITLARTRAEKGSYRITPSDFTTPEPAHAHLRGMPDCLVLLTTQHGITEGELAKQAGWLKNAFPGRVWLALTLPHQSGDELHRFHIGHVAEVYGLPVVAIGDVCMHVRSRKPMQDTLTAIRLGKPIAECGLALAPNAEQHLRPRLSLANLYPSTALAETLRIAKLCTFSLDELRYEYPDKLVPKGETAASYLRKETYIGASRRFTASIPANSQYSRQHTAAAGT